MLSQCQNHAQELDADTGVGETVGLTEKRVLPARLHETFGLIC
jgi:hypothetical protein